jgi:hypothetical protein
MKKKHQCHICGADKLPKDIVAANKKFFGTRLEKFFCLPCLAEFFGVTEQDILDKIEGFKEDGCALFK